jgi:hypothetical protein
MALSILRGHLQFSGLFFLAIFPAIGLKLGLLLYSSSSRFGVID